MSSIQHLLSDAPKGQHFCQLHKTAHTLDAALLTYATGGFQRGDALVVFAAPKRLETLRQHVANSGLNVGELETTAQLYLRDGGEVLDEFVRRNRPDWSGFRDTIDRTVTAVRARGWRHLRVYGDMVNDLWRAANTAEAIRLEQLWNDVRRHHDFCLFCGYELDGLDADVYADPIDDIARLHSAVPATAEDRAALRALDRACREVIGFPVADLVRRSPLATGDGVRGLPLAHQVVLWLRHNMPSSLPDVLERARQLCAETEAVARERRRADEHLG